MNVIVQIPQNGNQGMDNSRPQWAIAYEYLISVKVHGESAPKAVARDRAGFRIVTPHPSRNTGGRIARCLPEERAKTAVGRAS